MNVEDEMLSVIPLCLLESDAKMIRKFIRFVLGDFQKKQFQEWFYRRLRNTFDHIAHMNRDGFWETWFSSPQRQADFLRRCITFSPPYPPSLLEVAIQTWLKTTDLVERTTVRAREEQRTADIVLRDRLLVKYPLSKT